MDFVKDYQLVHVLLKIELWFAELGPICLGFEIKIDRWTLLSDRKCKRGLPNLARPNECHRSVGVDEVC